MRATESRTTPRRLPYAVVGGLLALVAIYAFATRAPATQLEGPAADSLSIRESHRFSSVPVLVATSDTVVIATVSDVAAGRTVGDPGAELTFTEVTLAVDETLWGAPSQTVSLEIDYPAPWAAVGEQAVFFLHEKTDETAKTYFRPVNMSQSVYRVSGERLESPTADDGFAASVADMNLSALVAEIQRAVPLIEAGVVKAATPSGPRPASEGD